MNHPFDAPGARRGRTWRSMLGFAVLALTITSVACSKSDDKAAGDNTAKAAGDNTAPVRRVAIEVTREGYEPDLVKARPNEEVTLQFTRTDEADCGQFVKVEDGQETELPLGEPVDIPIIMPESGEVTFVCGMGVMKGVVLVVAN